MGVVSNSPVFYQMTMHPDTYCKKGSFPSGLPYVLCERAGDLCVN